MIRFGSPPLPIVATASKRTMSAVNHPGRRRGTSTGEIFMRALISALAVAGLVTIALPTYAADPVTTDPAKAAAKPGRAIDEGGAVKTDPKPLNSPGRAADDSSGKQDVKTGKPATYGRAADDTKPATTTTKKKKKTTKTPATPAPTN
jgi:hypothetical protein